MNPDSGIDERMGWIWTGLNHHSKEELIAHIRWLYRYIEELENELESYHNHNHGSVSI